jgi:hypothetical protein
MIPRPEDTSSNMDGETIVADTQATEFIEDEGYFFINVVFLVWSLNLVQQPFELMGIQVEDTYFNLPRHYFEHYSVVFRDMFQLPSSNDEPLDGSSKELPLRLDGVDKTDFRRLLKVMFHMSVRSSIPNPLILMMEAVIPTSRWS